jgi:hypothetical protein
MLILEITQSAHERSIYVLGTQAEAACSPISGAVSMRTTVPLLLLLLSTVPELLTETRSHRQCIASLLFEYDLWPNFYETQHVGHTLHS